MKLSLVVLLALLIASVTYENNARQLPSANGPRIVDLDPEIKTVFNVIP